MKTLKKLVRGVARQNGQQTADSGTLPLPVCLSISLSISLFLSLLATDEDEISLCMIGRW